MSLLSEKRETVFSPCRKYRYRLRQIWDPSLPLVCFLMLNPSTADEIKNDPTVERVERRCRKIAGCGGMEVVNIFAFRSTAPDVMKTQPDPVGPNNDMHILEATRSAMMVVCAWGRHGQHMGRGNHVLQMLHDNNIPTFCLKVNSDGYPAHPLYIGYDIEPMPFTPVTVLQNDHGSKHAEGTVLR